MKLFNHKGLTKLGLGLAVVVGLLTPSAIKAETIQPCVNGGSTFYPKCQDEEMVAPALYPVVVVILELMTIKVAEDVLVGYLANIYGGTWDEIIKVLDPKVVASRVDAYVISIGKNRIGIDDFVRRYK